MPEGRHRNAIGLTGRRDALSVPRGHGLGEGALQPTSHRRPLAVRGTEANRVHHDAVVGRERPHHLEVLDVLVDARGGVSVGPVDDDVLRVALVKVLPLLTRVDPEVEVIEGGQILRQLAGQALELR